jgi:NAD(P)H-hydrate epimerase
MRKKISLKEVKGFFDKNKRKVDTSKYDCGHILVVSGSLGMLGASILATRATLKSGAGIVTSAIPRGLMLTAMNHFVEEMALSVDTELNYYFDLNSFDFLEHYLRRRKIDAVVIGPGLNRKQETIDFTKKFFKFVVDLNIPIVIDSDALYAISYKNINTIRNCFRLSAKYTKSLKNVILTPHEKEMSTLINCDLEFVRNNRELCCQKAAKKNGLVCILKGANTVISDGKEVFVNTTGNPGMSTAGAGDVLSGILAGLQGRYKEESMINIAKVGVFLHGLSGDIAKDNIGEESLVASDIIKFLPETFKKILEF